MKKSKRLDKYEIERQRKKVIEKRYARELARLEKSAALLAERMFGCYSDCTTLREREQIAEAQRLIRRARNFDASGVR